VNRSTISVVDDDPSAREGITDLVKSMGFEAHAFERAEEFLKSDRLDRTDCLITDMRMPGMSGLELHDQLVKSGHSIPTIVVTAFPEAIDRLRLEQAGICCYLAKPCDEKNLLECIHAALAGAQRRS
jgi:FixJ family two-component response regulator